MIEPETLLQLHIDVVETICELEMYFPPAFFDIMVHLTVHLVREIKICGPVFLRYMYPFERAMGVMKRMVRSRSRLEGSIVEGYVAEEVIEFVSDYLSGVEPIGLPRSRHAGSLQGVGTIGFKSIYTTYEVRQKAHTKVLQHLDDVTPFIEEHINELRLNNPTKPDTWINSQHDLNFATWFEERIRVLRSSQVLSETVRFLANGPTPKIYSYQGYKMNGYTWYTQQQDKKSINQNSGVTVTATFEDDNTPVAFYGWIEEIWELDYFLLRIPIFKCKWIDNKKGGVTKDRDGFIIVDHKRLGYQNDPFILASKAKQVRS